MFINRVKNYSYKKKKILQRQRRIDEFSKELQENIPHSERWFMEKVFPRIKDFRSNFIWRFNERFEDYIPDVREDKYKFIIEIDGISHLDESQILVDEEKDRFYRYMKYEVFRVKAYNNYSTECFMVKLKQYLFKRPNTIIRRNGVLLVSDLK